MTSKLLTILLSFLSFTTLAQKNSKVIIIDTVEGPLHVIKIAAVNSTHLLLDDFYPMGIHDTGNGFNIITIDLNKTQLHCIATIIHYKDTSDLLKLPIDDSGGELTIRSAFLSKCDTIHFNKLTVFHNCFPDSIFNSLTWFKRIRQDTLDTLIHLKHYHSENVKSKDCNQFNPNSVVITINHIDYKLSLNKVEAPECQITNYHGMPKMNKRKRRKYEENRELSKSYKYFAGTRVVKKYCFKADVILKSIDKCKY